MKTIIGFLVMGLLLLLVIGCGDDITKVEAQGDIVYHIGPDAGLPGNTEWYIMPWTSHGPAILVINGPANPVGYQIRNGASIYFQDKYIGSGGDSFVTGGNLPLNEWMQLNYVIYESAFAGWLWPIADFWESLNDLIVQDSYEWEIKLINNPDNSELTVEIRTLIEMVTPNGYYRYENIYRETIQAQRTSELPEDIQMIILDHLDSEE